MRHIIGTALRLVPLGIVLIAAAALAALPKPSGDPVLTITGKVRETNGPWGAAFDWSTLETLPHVVIRTTTPWTEGVQQFEGVLVRDVLAAAGGRGDTVKAMAAGERAVEIPAVDFERYAVIIAFRQNGSPIAAGNKGPLWIVYPLDEHREIQNSEFHARMIGQLRELRIR
ncbi:MAG: hypothetical protein U1F33_01565 [Alphaproteobacteria bacterium]